MHQQSGNEPWYRKHRNRIPLHRWKETDRRFNSGRLRKDWRRIRIKNLYMQNNRRTCGSIRGRKETGSCLPV